MSDEQLFDVFTIGQTKFPNRLDEDLAVNQSVLSEEFAHHAERFAWYSTAYELAANHEARLKEELARAYAHVDARVREDARGSGVKMTEKAVENTVITHPIYNEVQEEYLTAKRNTGLLKSARDAMIHRRDMLIQLGANYRAEGVSDIALREQHYKANK